MRHIVLVVWDSCRIHDTALGGYTRDTTPFLARLADEATEYRQARATAPWTLPSHASMFTGLYPREHGVRGDETRFALPDRHLASVLSDAGYRTQLHTSNTYLREPEFGFATTFDRVESRSDVPFEAGIDPETFVSRHRIGAYRTFVREVLAHDHPLQSVANGLHAKFRETAAYDLLQSGDSWAADNGGETYVDGVLSALDGGDPTFAFVNLMETHLPYRPPEKYRRWVDGDGYRSIEQTPPWRHYDAPAETFRTLRALYDGSIWHADDITRRLYDGLADRGLLDETLFVVTSDHGELFGEASPGRGVRPFGHQNGVEEELLHVPLVVRRPGGESRTVDDRTSLAGLYGTMLRAAGVETDARTLGDDGPVFGEWAGFREEKHQRAAEFGVDTDPFDGPLVATYRADGAETEKLVWVPDSNERAAYRIDERGDVTTTEPRADAFQTVCSAYEGLERVAGEGRRVELSEKTKEELRDLGYV